MRRSEDAFWRALSNPIRRRILDWLRDGPRTTGEVAEAFPVLSRFAVMQHLGVLEDAGLVLPRREGRQRFNYLNAVPLREMYERWVNRYASDVAGAAMRLKAYVEKGEQVETVRLVRIESEIQLRAPIEQVFRAITLEFGEWWPHRYGDGARLVFEPHLGGRVYEDWGHGAGALYGEVTAFDPPHAVTVRGPWGLGDAAYAIVAWRCERDGDATRVRRTLRLWGDIPEEVAEEYRDGAARMLAEVLKPYVEGAAQRAG